MQWQTILHAMAGTIPIASPAWYVVLEIAGDEQWKRNGGV